MGRKAIIAGASGLIGGKLLDILLAAPAYDEVMVLVRKRLPVTHMKLKQLEVKFDELDSYATALTGNALFCCLGSTKRKTPDLKDYRKVDHDYPLKLAEIGHANKVSHYMLVSSIGADASSKNFYTKMKGETEASITSAGIRSLHIFRPSFLTGDRNEKRVIEKIAGGIMKLISPLLLGNLKNYRSIPAATVAMAMYKQSLNNTEGKFIHSSEEIKELA